MGNHWYAQNGAPAYETNGHSTTLRDARKLGLAPSVTTILGIIHKEQLERWKVQQGILAALTMPRGEDSEEAWLAKVMADSKRQAKEAAEEGSRIHDAIEKAYKASYSMGEPYFAHVDATCDEVERLFPNVTDWVSEKSFYHPLGFGGKVDLHSPSTGIVVDFKGKDGDFSDGKKLAYDQNIQLAAYQVGLGLNGLEEYRAEYDFVEPSLHVQCANIFVSRTHPGKVCSYVWDAQDVAYGWSVFEAALELWKRLLRYNPADYIQPCAA